MLARLAVKLILPVACFWAERQEHAILRDGVGLTPQLLADAKRLGVACPERIRLLAVEKVPPLPLSPWLRKMGEKCGLISRFTAGMSLRYGIFVRSDWWGHRRLIIHELAHTAQYERLGGFRGFLEAYLAECVSPGYPFGALEQEAERRVEELVKA